MRLPAILSLLAVLWPVQSGQSGLARVVPPNPNPGGFIHDGGPVLSPEERTRLNSKIGALQAGGRGDIGVAIIRDIGDYPPYEVGKEIYRTWRIGAVDSIGSARRDLGVLLLIVPKELAPDGKGQCWITTGLGAEGLITDATAGGICRDAIIPHLRDRDYAAALDAGIDAIAARLVAGVPAGTRPPIPRGGPGRPSPWAKLVAIFTALAAGLGSLIGWRRHRRRKPRLCPRGHGPMVLLSETADDAALAAGQITEEEIKSVDYDVWECPVCRERLILRYKRWFSGYSKCPKCGFWTLKTETRTITAATTVSTGLSRTTKTCLNCHWSETTEHVIPMVTESSSSSGGSSWGGSSGGGSSFGGSGSTSGGGGGSSY